MKIYNILIYSLIAVLVIFLSIKNKSFAQDVKSINTSKCTFEGSWDTRWGRMELKQDNFKLKGTYDLNKGTVEGVIYGRYFIGKWSQSPSYKPPEDSGNINLILSDDCNSFKNDWYINDWNGSRVDYSKPVIVSNTGDIEQLEGLFYLGNNTMLDIDVPENWSHKIDSRKNVVFSNDSEKKDKLFIYIFNSVFPYTTSQNRSEIVSAHIKGMSDSFKNTTKEGVDYINGISIRWVAFPEKIDDITYHNKVLYPYNNNKIFMLMVTTTQKKIPEREIRTLLDRILKAIEAEKSM